MHATFSISEGELSFLDELYMKYHYKFSTKGDLCLLKHHLLLCALLMCASFIFVTFTCPAYYFCILDVFT